MNNVTPLAEPSKERPPQFYLRTLFGVVTGLCVVLAVLVSIGMIWATVVSFTFLVVGAHVAANALGTKLRDEKTAELAQPGGDRERPVARTGVWCPPAASRLQQKDRAGRLTILIALAGALFAGTAGAIAIAITHWDRINAPALAVAALASAVIGALSTYAVASFVITYLHAWRDLWREHRSQM